MRVRAGDFAGLDGDRVVNGSRGNAEYSATNSAAYARAVEPATSVPAAGGVAVVATSSGGGSGGGGGHSRL